jgi:preprotein translocase subunit SecF
VEVLYQNARPDIEQLRTTLATAGFDQAALQPAGDQGLIIRLATSDSERKTDLYKALNADNQHPFAEQRFDSIGPTLGKELSQRGSIAIALVTLLIILFIAFAFRQVSRPVSSWKYGVVALVALLHDLIIPIGAFALLGHYYPAIEADALFLTGLLTILGLSIHDTIVVFDRIREHLRGRHNGDFPTIVGQSLSETFTRSINTSLTIILVLVIMYLFGAPSIKYFSLLMAIGVLVGTYSSIFIASPLLVVWAGKVGKK